MVDAHVAGDRQQPGDLGAAPGIEPAPRPERPLKRRLRQVLGRVPVLDSVGEEAVHAPQVLVVDASKVGIPAIHPEQILSGFRRRARIAMR